MQTIDHAARASALRAAGANCAAAVLGAYADTLGLTVESAQRLAAGLGAGLGDGQGTCGAVLAAHMVLGQRFGDDPHALKAQTRAFRAAFRAQVGEDLRCAQLRKNKQSCDTLVAQTIQLLEEAERP